MIQNNWATRLLAAARGIFDLELDFKKPMLRGIIIALIPIDIIYVSVSWSIQNTRSLALHGIILLCALASLFIFYLKLSEQLFKRLYFTLVTIALIALLITNMQDFAGQSLLHYSPWILVVAIMGTFLLGRGSGIIWAVTYLVGVGIPFVIFLPNELTVAEISSLKLFTVVVAMMITALMVIFEWTAGNAHREAKKQQQEAMEANKAKSTFLANMSHELRTPMNHIIGFTELTMDRRTGDLNGKQREYLEDVAQSSKHLLSLINDMLDLSKIEAGKLNLNISTVDLSQLIRASVGVVAEKIAATDVDVDVNVDELPMEVHVDERKITQVMYNLLSNAAKFTPEGGTISINCGNNGSNIYISVKDTGPGLYADELETIFQPFEQGDTSSPDITVGTGLGLSLSRSLIELHHGTLVAESAGKGRGSTFTVTLPTG